MNRSLAAGLLVAMLLAGLPVAGGAGATDGVDRAGEPSALQLEPGVSVDHTDSGVLQANESDDDNETVRHRHPDEQNPEEGDLGGWLAGRLADRLGGGIIQISEGQYERARELVGDDYEDRLGQYIEVTGANEEEADTLRESRETQQELADLREEFEETREAYEQALADGDTERARELARKLVVLAERIESVSVELEELLAEIEGVLDEDLSESLEAVEEIREEVQLEVATVVEETLTETELTVETQQETVSFLDPLVATGQLRTAGGEPIANESIRATIAGTEIDAETNGEGVFTVEYRPAALPLDTETVRFRYVPDEESAYLGSEDSVSVTIEQVEPTLTVTDAPDTVRFGDRMTVRGTLDADGVPVGTASLDVELGGQSLGTVTVSEGSFEGTVTVPAAVPDGNRTLAVRLPYTNQALAGVADSRSVTVRETETALSMAATTADGADGAGSDAAIRVNGTLETVQGAGVEGEPIDVRVDGVSAGTVTTGTDGGFSGTVAVPDAVGGRDVTVTAAYPGTGNLAPSQSTSAVTLPPEADESEDGSQADESEDGPIPDAIRNELDALSVLLAIVIVVALIGGAVWWSRRRDSSMPTPTDQESQTPSETIVITTAETESTDPLDPAFAQASAQIDAGRPGQAVQVCYAAVRDHLEAGLGVTGPLTHWEFYRACLDRLGDSDDGADGAGDVLRTVTEEYERAVYGVDDVSEETALGVLDAARELYGPDDGAEGSAGSEPTADD